MKRRFTVTLEEDHVKEFQALAKSMGLRAGVMSELCDEAIQKTTAMMKEFAARHQAKGSLSIGDLFAVMSEQVGEQLKEIEKEEKERAEKQERAAAPRKKRA